MYLSLENVSKSYGEKVLFDRVELPVNKGHKVALVARNGAGKSTFLRVAAGVDQPEGLGAKVFVHPQARLEYLTQEPDFADDLTVLETALAGSNPKLQAVARYEKALLFPDRAEAMQTALAAMDDLKAWDIEARVKEVLSKLKLDDFEQTVGTLSGGQQKRLALAKLIINEPDLVILDEPTNHLDLDMIEWLEEWLSQTNLTLLMVTHDRYFLERVCNQIVELEGGNLYRYSGNYSEYLHKKEVRHEIEGSEHDKNKKLLKRELEWLNRQPKARGTKGKARIDKAYDLKDRVGNFKQEQDLQIDIKGQRLGKTILEAHHIVKAYGDNVIIDGFSYKFKKGERVGIVGPNGAGKTTFLELLTQQIRPDQGKVKVGGNTVFGYYTQDGIQLKDDQRVIDVIRDIAEYIPMEKGQKLTAPQLLERFMFSRKQQQVYVSQLSGGEKRRLYLLTVLMRNPNFLILDEPTNDLDIMTLNVLEDFLMEFPGCILIVSHDRYFLDKVVDHLFVFEGKGRLRDFLGDYSEYRVEQKERESQERSQQRAIDQKEKAKAAAAAEAQAGGLTREQKKQIQRIERKIQKLEERKTEINQAFLGDLSMEEIESLGKELAQLNTELEEREMEWMELAEQA